MIIVLAIDALEYDLVEKFGCRHLKQRFYGKTDLSEFTQPRTVVLWSSFMTGVNKEEEILAKGSKGMWNTRFDIRDTFFSRFKNPIIHDLPGFNYNRGVHDKSRALLKKFFEIESGEGKKAVREEYNKDAFDHHRKMKKRVLDALDKGHDLVLGYFSVVDELGHLNFGNTLLMKMIYRDMDDIAKGCAKKNCPMVVLSDHGMKAVGMFGDHSDYGFWSLNVDGNLKNPKITDFYSIITSLGPICNDITLPRTSSSTQDKQEKQPLNIKK